MSGTAWTAGAAAAPVASDSVSGVATAGSPVGYSGLITRAIAMNVDAVVVNAVALIVAGASALVTAMLPGSQKLHALEIAIAAFVYVIWVVAYFATFWSTTGQTPGARVMHIRVTRLDGGRLHAARAIARFGGTILAAIPLFAGFLPILVSPRRRAVNDWIGHSVVVQYEPDAPSANARTSGRAGDARAARPRS